MTYCTLYSRTFGYAHSKYFTINVLNLLNFITSNVKNLYIPNFNPNDYMSYKFKLEFITFKK